MKKFVPIALKTAAVLLTASTAYLYYQNSQIPPLGVENGQFQPLSSKPNCISTQAADLNKRVDPLPFGDSTELTMKALKEAVKTQGRGTIFSETPNYLRVVFTTPIMRFRDDVEFWLDEENRLVHFRASARAGYSDLGKNRERYENLRKFYLQSLSAK